MSESMLPAAILAGGLATRLRPVTENIPKALIEINGEPFIAHQLRLLAGRGIERVVILAGYLGEAIEHFVGDGKRFGLKAEYSHDWPKLLGTAGAVKQALPLLGESFFVIYGDSYLPCDYQAIKSAFIAGGKPALMTVFRNEGLWDHSNVEYDGGRIVAYDKNHRTERMRHIDYGLGVFSKQVFDMVPEQQYCDLAWLYRELLERGELASCEVTQRFYEIGSFEGLEELSALLHHMNFTEQYLAEAAKVIERLDTRSIEKMVDLLAATRDRGGRLFILGVGGGAANASHAVNDFRKIAGLEAYAPTDNVSELTARANDEGWASVFDAWLRTSKLSHDDLVLIFSVGGGNLENNISPNLVAALQYAGQTGAKVIGVVGRDGGYTAKVADACIIIPTVNIDHVTPHTEAFQALVWHLLVSHPKLKVAQTKWESVR